MTSPGAPLPTMPLIEHLRELRNRLLYSVVAVVGGMVLALSIAERVKAGLTRMCDTCGGFIALTPTENFATHFRIALILGLAVAMPIILYQIVAYVLPALHRHERRYLLYLLPGAGLMFALGLAFGYFLVLPRSINFLASFAAGGVQQTWSISEYISFVTNLLLVCGVTFQTPIVVYLLAKLGLLKANTMAKYRRHAIVLFAVLAAVLTPTPDPFTMFIVMTPMVLLYELGILMARFL